ncbi:MAG: glucose-6-phosphate isomerase [Tannerella sp.]|jgi:glucose-6-phosphate isomerase|nr:glucose-6-phosphate isomerase [Tannerella sp.]
MDKIRLNLSKTLNAITREQIYAFKSPVKKVLEALDKGSGAGGNMLGWMDLPRAIMDYEVREIEDASASLRARCEFVVVTGIGGSYLGTKAVLEALNNSFDGLLRERKNPVLLYAGHNIGEDYLYELTELLKGRSFGIINISKSGTTTEPALAFRILKKQLEEAVGKAEARKYIMAVTDRARGALRTLAEQEGYRTFVIPDNIGGRFSVLTPAGLLPLAVAGIDIGLLIAGAVAMEFLTSSGISFGDNIAVLYAVARNALYAAGKKIEILANFHPKLHYLGEWWKQLYGESEGKEHKGLFPVSVDYTTDLHSLGQWIQEGERTVFETVISIEKPDHKMWIPADEADLDGLNYLAGKRVDEVNKMAELGTQLAHVAGGVPNIRITVPRVDAWYVGQLLYLFERACGISGYLLGVNPFDQPGVEAYKKNMFALLKKPGYEKESAAIASECDRFAEPDMLFW